VSKWLVYADGVREHIEQARQQQAGRKIRDRRRGLQPSTASLQTDLALARADNARLRTERDRLKAAVQRGLGQQVNQLSAKDMAARIDELTRANLQLIVNSHGFAPTIRASADVLSRPRMTSPRPA
jgi:hypothetical protein